MARPPKDDRDRMSETVRIPVTADQKRLITEAASVNPLGVAAWARDVLLQAAQGQPKPNKSRRRSEQEG